MVHRLSVNYVEHLFFRKPSLNGLGDAGASKQVLMAWLLQPLLLHWTLETALGGGWVTLSKSPPYLSEPVSSVVGGQRNDYSPHREPSRGSSCCHTWTPPQDARRGGQEVTLVGNPNMLK